MVSALTHYIRRQLDEAARVDERTRRWAVVGLCLAVLLLSGCGKVQVSQDYRSGRDYSRLHSYRWQAVEPAESRDIRVNNPLQQERFRQAIDGNLARRGYIQAAVADFVVGYSYSIQTRLESEPFRPSVGFGFGRYYNYGAIGVGTDIGVSQYDVGVLVIDFSDARSGEPLWRGTATQLATTHTTPEEATAFVYRMVDAVLAQFPPR